MCTCACERASRLHCCGVVACSVVGVEFTPLRYHFLRRHRRGSCLTVVIARRIWAWGLCHPGACWDGTLCLEKLYFRITLSVTVSLGVLVFALQCLFCNISSVSLSSSEVWSHLKNAQKKSVLAEYTPEAFSGKETDLDKQSELLVARHLSFLETALQIRSH